MDKFLPSAQQAQEMLNLGHINEQTYNNIISAQPQVQTPLMQKPLQQGLPQSITNPIAGYDPNVVQPKMNNEGVELVDNLLKPQSPWASKDEIDEINDRRKLSGLTTDVDGKPLVVRKTPPAGPSDLEREQADLMKRINQDENNQQAGSKQFQQDFGYLKKAQEQMKTAEAERKAKQFESEESRKKLQTEIDNLTKQPIKNYWADKSTSDRALAAISIALSGIGNAFMGKGGDPNAAWKIIDNAIDRDIKLQQQDKSDKMNLFKMSMQNLGDERSAYLASYNAMLNNVQNMVNFQTKNSELQMKQQELNAVLDQKRNEKNAGLIQQAATNDQLIKAGIKSDPYSRIAKEPASERLVPALGTTAPNKGNADKFNKFYTSVLGSKEALNQLRDVTSTGAWKSLPGSDAYNKIKTLKELLPGQLKDLMAGEGTMSDSDKESIKTAVGNPDAFFSFDSNSLLRIRTLVNTIDRITDSTAKAYGIQNNPDKESGQLPSFMKFGDAK